MSETEALIIVNPVKYTIDSYQIDDIDGDNPYVSNEMLYGQTKLIQKGISMAFRDTLQKDRNESIKQQQS